MINEELLAEVLNIKEVPWNVTVDDKHVYVTYTVNTHLGKEKPISTRNKNTYISWGENKKDTYNIHELAHKFKKWAYVKNCDIQSFVGLELCHALVFEGSVKMICNVTAKSEPEAIFKACEWVYKNKGVNNG